MVQTRARFDKNEARFEAFEGKVGEMSTNLRQLTIIIGQMEKSINSMQDKGRFPRDTVVNLRENYSAIALRSGNSYGKSKLEK